MIIDDVLVLLGSCNLTSNGFINNVEHMVRITEVQTVQDVVKSFEYWKSQSDLMNQTDMDKTMDLDADRKTVKTVFDLTQTFAEAYNDPKRRGVRKTYTKENLYVADALQLDEVQRQLFDEDHPVFRPSTSDEEVELHNEIARKESSLARIATIKQARAMRRATIRKAQQDLA